MKNFINEESFLEVSFYLLGAAAVGVVVSLTFYILLGYFFPENAMIFLGNLKEVLITQLLSS